MEKLRSIALLQAVAMVVIVVFSPCQANEKKEEDKSTIFSENESRSSRQPGSFELTDAEKNRLLEAVKKSDPKKAKEIAGLRKKNPKRFIEELKNNAREEYDRIVGGRVEKWLANRRQERRNAFKDWLKQNVPEVAEDMNNLLISKNPDLYEKKYNWVYKKYERVFYESRRHPEEAKVLLEDLRLQDRRDYLVNKLKHIKNEKDKQRILAQLEGVLSDRYDLILIRRQMAYERLLRRLETLQKDIEKSRGEIEEYKKKDIKDKNIQDRIKTLIEGKKGILN